MLGLGRQTLLVTGGHALRHGEQEALHRPCLQEQSQKRTQRQPQQRIGLQRRQIPLQVVLLCTEPWIELRAFLRVRANNNTATNEARPGVSLETATISPGPRPPPNPKTRPAKPKTPRTLETPYTGSSSRPLQSPFGPYPYRAAAAATSRSFGGGSAETRSDQLTFAWRL